MLFKIQCRIVITETCQCIVNSLMAVFHNKHRCSTHLPGGSVARSWDRHTCHRLVLQLHNASM